MNPIIGIPTTRVSNQFVRQRMLNQVQADQVAIYLTETQLSTGHRFSAPSDDPIAAMRVMSLQSLIERKVQVTSNLNTNQSFLSATDSALGSVSSMLADVRATALGVLGTTASDIERQAAAQEIVQALRQMVDTGNQQFRGRYLFAGSTTTTMPFDYVDGQYVSYSGNNQSLVSYGDIDLLFDTNISGVEAFGAISDPVLGATDLDPVLTFDTKIADLRGGKGLPKGSIAISDGTNTSLIDLSGADTVGDLAALIQANPPTNREVTVEITPTKLIVTLDSVLPGSLSIREVGGGTVADALGLLKPIGTGKSIAGRDLNPVLRNTTSLDDICGVRARTTVYSSGSDNNVILEADTNGVETSDHRPLNGVTMTFVHDALVEPGQETVVYNGTDSIQVHIAGGYSSAAQVVTALNNAHTAGTIPFTARLDPLDSAHGGRGPVTAGGTGTTQYGSGENFDKASGMRVINSGQEFTIAFPLAETVEDLLNTLNGSEAGVLAEINVDKTGVNLRSRVSGCDFAIGENGGETASQLGLRTMTEDSLLEELGFGRGVDDWTGSGTRATAVYDIGVPNTSLTFTAQDAGNDWNHFDISIVNTAGVPSIDYDPVLKTMRINVNEGTTTASDVIELLRIDPVAGPHWMAALTPVVGGTNDGTGLVEADGIRTSSGGEGAGIDFTIYRADERELAIDVHSMTTIGDVIEAINDHPSNADHLLVARPSEYGNGIELVDSSEGTDTTKVVCARTSQAAINLGLVPVGQTESALPTATGFPTTTILSTAPKSGLIFTARSPGTETNGVRVIFQDVPAPPPPPPPVPENPVFNADLKTLTFGIQAGTTTAADVAALLAASPLTSVFEVEFDPDDNSHNNGTRLVTATSVPNPPRTTGGTATAYASATVVSTGTDNDLIFTTKTLGTANNNIAIRLVPTAGVTQVTSYIPGTELVIEYNAPPPPPPGAGTGTANAVIAAVQAHPAANADFTVTRDPRDFSANLGEGLVDATDGTEPLMTGGEQIITGIDVNPCETESIFTAFMRVQQGLESNDMFVIERAMAMLELKTTDMDFARAELGAREQGVDMLMSRLEMEDVQLQTSLSIDYDADLASVISELSARQAAFEASLKAMGNIYQMTLLDYL